MDLTFCLEPVPSESTQGAEVDLEISISLPLHYLLTLVLCQFLP
jgi:hypothetical protein